MISTDNRCGYKFWLGCIKLWNLGQLSLVTDTQCPQVKIQFYDSCENITKQYVNIQYLEKHLAYHIQNYDYCGIVSIQYHKDK